MTITQLRQQLGMAARKITRLTAENEDLRARVKRLEAEQRDGADCVRAFLEVRKSAQAWLRELEPKKYLGRHS